MFRLNRYITAMHLCLIIIIFNESLISLNFLNFNMQVDIAVPEVFIGGLLGSMLIFVFSAWACSAVGRTAQEVVNEVRRQFIERPGIMVSIQSLPCQVIVVILR